MIILCHGNVKKISHIIKKNNEINGEYTWGILGENFQALKDCHDIYGNEKRDRGIGPLFHKISRNLRSPVLEFLGKLSAENSSREWWSSGLASKSIFLQSLFLRICYLKLLEELKKQEKNIILYIPDLEFFSVLKQKYANNCLFITDNSLLLYSCLYYFRQMYLKNKRFLKCLLNKGMLSGRKKESLDMETLVFSSTVKKSFDKSLRYEDLWGGSFFDNFSSYSKCKRLASSSIQPASLKKSLVSDTKFIYPMMYCSWFDILSIYFTKVSLSDKADYIFQGINLKPLVQLEMDKNNGGVIYSPILLNKGLLRIINESPKLKMIFHPFEGQPWEKLIKLAVQSSQKEIKTFGFQHSAFSELHLSNYCSKKEFELGTMPDYLLVNSNYNKDKLSNDGYPPENIIMIGDLRFGYLNQKKKQDGVNNVGTKKILVCLTVKKDESLMALFDLSLSFKNLKNNGHQFKVIVKPHPSTPLDWNQISFVQELGDSIEYYEGDIKEALNNTDLLIYINGAVGCEALQLGKTVIQKYTDLAIDLDPLNVDEKKSLLYPCFFDQVEERLEDYFLGNLNRDQNLKNREVPSYFDPIQHDNFDYIKKMGGMN